MGSVMLMKSWRPFPIALVFLLTASAVDAENLIPGDSSFESGLGAIAVAAIEKGAWGVDGAEAFDGRQSLKLPCHGWNRFYSRPLTVVDGPATFSLYAKAEGGKIRLRLRISDINLNSMTKTMELVDVGREWRRYELAGVLKRGLHCLEIEAQGSGVVWVDAVQFERAAQATPYVNNARDCVAVNIPMDSNYVFFKGERIPVGLAVYDGPGGGFGERRLSVKVADFNGGEAVSKEFEVKSKDGRFSADFDFMPDAPGWYGVKAILSDGGRRLGEASSMVSVVERPVELKSGKAPFCGIVGEDFPGALRIGGRWLEDIVRWGWMENVKGKMSFRDYSFMHAAGCKGKVSIQVIASPKWAWDPREVEECEKLDIKPGAGLLPAKERLGDWRMFIRKLVQSCKGKVDYMEVGAEDDLSFGGSTYYLRRYPDCAEFGMIVRGPAYERYLEMLAIACEEIRKGAPEIKIGIVRPSNCDCQRYLFSSPAIKRLSKYMDVFPVDSYTYPRNIGPGQGYSPMPEEFFPASLGKAIEACRANGSGQPIGISEFGYAMDYRVEPDGEYAKEMVKRLTRAHLVARMTPNVEFLHWFRTDRAFEGGAYGYGLWNFGLPFPSVAAYGAVARIVENVEESRVIPLNGDAKGVVFRKAGRADAAVWMLRGDSKLHVSALPDGLVVSNVMGGPVQPKSGEMASVIKIDEFPTYFSLEGASAFDSLAKMLSSARMVGKPVKACFLFQLGDTATLQLRNQAGEDLEARISVRTGGSAMPDVAKTIAKDDTLVLKIPIDGMSPKIDVSVDCGKDYEKVSASSRPSFERCKRIAFAGKVDGDMSKWAGHPYIGMDERVQIQPPDPHIQWRGPEQFSAKVYTGWDDSYLYFAAEVKDDFHSNRFPAEICKGDSIQLALDPLSDASGLSAKTMEYGKDDFELGMACIGGKAVVAQWAGAAGLWKESEYAMRRDEAAKLTAYEIRIPLFSLSLAPAEGMAFGMNFVIFNDATGAGAGYWYQLSPGITGGKRPALFKKFVLVR